MIDAGAHRPVYFWKEILPLSVIAAILFYLTLIWNPVVVGVVLLPAVIFAFVFYPRQLWWVVIGMAPLSIDLELYVDTAVSMYLPTEPLLFGFLLLSLLYLVRHPVQRSFFYHPVLLLLMAYFGWTGISVITSSDPWVSLKSFTVQMWFVVPVLLLGSRLLDSRQNRERFFRIYIFSFSIVVLYTLIRLAWFGFPVKESMWLMQPFFKDHTLLGAVLGLTIPYVYLKCFEKKITTGKRILWIGLAAVFTAVLIYTYSRAALLSLGVAAGLYICIALKIRFRYLMAAGILLAGLALIYQDTLVHRLQQNQAESSGELKENIESISNVSSDASNLERINRWNAAIEMAKDRPLFGFGPGTYQFEYAPFQKSADLTIISTNIGDIGNAHSEFLGPLAESGWPAAVLFTLFVISIIGTGYRTVLNMEGRDRLILMAALLGITAYFAHGVLNNFLDSDKVSVLVWGFTAIIVYYNLEKRISY